MRISIVIILVTFLLFSVGLNIDQYLTMSKLQREISVSGDPISVDKYQERNIVLHRTDLQIDGRTRHFACSELIPEFALTGWQEQIGWKILLH